MSFCEDIEKLGSGKCEVQMYRCEVRFEGERERIKKDTLRNVSG